MIQRAECIAWIRSDGVLPFAGGLPDGLMAAPWGLPPSPVSKPLREKSGKGWSSWLGKGERLSVERRQQTSISYIRFEDAENRGQTDQESGSLEDSS